jgi:outer membrane lipoprotein-sorting protein
MRAALMPPTAPSGTELAPLARAIEHFRTVEAYRVTLHASRADGEHLIRYAYRRPGFVRMEFIRPHAGAVLVYSPLTRRVRLWPFGAGRFPELSLSPHNPLVRGPGGQTVDQSDVGALFENIRALLEQGHAALHGEARVAGRSALHLAVTGAPGQTVAGVHRYELWLDPASQFPLRVVSRDQADAVIETVVLEDLEVNPPLPEATFNPEGR